MLIHVVLPDILKIVPRPRFLEAVPAPPNMSHQFALRHIVLQDL